MKKTAAKTSNREMALFCRKFATLIGSGIPVVQAMECCAEESGDKALSKALMAVRESLRQDPRAMGAKMGEFPGVFSASLRIMISAGELGGVLDVNAARLADMYEKACALS